jgi:hypothetical protein
MSGFVARAAHTAHFCRILPEPRNESRDSLREIPFGARQPTYFFSPAILAAKMA